MGGKKSHGEAVVFHQLFTPFELKSEGMRKCSQSDKIYGRVKVIFFSPPLRVREQEVILEKVSLLLKNVKQRTRYT